MFISEKYNKNEIYKNEQQIFVVLEIFLKIEIYVKSPFWNIFFYIS